MKKTILIPTDFSIESLNLLKAAAQLAYGRTIDVVFFQRMMLTDSIFDLLFSTPRAVMASLITKEFEEGCRIIQNKFSSRIENIRYEVFTGNSQAAFGNFLLGNEIDQIFIPKKYALQLKDRRSADPLPFIKRSALPVHEVPWHTQEHMPEKNKLAELFSV